MKKAKQEQAASFEEQMARLQEIVQQLEEGKIPLQESVQLYKEGVTLSTQCREMLVKAQHEISVVTEEALETFSVAQE